MVRRDRPQPVVAALSKAAVLFPSPWGEGQGEGEGGLETLVWDHPISIASGVLRLRRDAELREGGAVSRSNAVEPRMDPAWRSRN